MAASSLGSSWVFLSFLDGGGGLAQDVADLAGPCLPLRCISSTPLQWRIR